MLLRIGSTLAATIMFAVMGTALALWGINVLPSEPLRVGFIVLVVAACIGGLRTVARAPRLMHASATRARPAQVPEPMLVAIPATSPIGICWQCGSAVRAENLVCWKCGATQPQQRDLLPPIVPGRETDWDSSETVYRVPEPDVLPTGSLPIYRVDEPDGWSQAEGWSQVDASTFEAPPAAGERWVPSPELDDAYPSLAAVPWGSSDAPPVVEASAAPQEGAQTYPPSLAAPAMDGETIDSPASAE